MESALLQTSGKDHVKNISSSEGNSQSKASTSTSSKSGDETYKIGTTKGTTVKQRQRLIPLTSEIIKAMTDFNVTHSETSVCNTAPDKSFYNTFSITSLVREEVQNILHELSVAEKFIRKEDLDALIERCIKDKFDTRDGKLEISDSDAGQLQSQNIEVTVEMMNDVEKNKLIVENFQILEQRITNLEVRISSMLQTIPKLRCLQARKFKINTKIIREELQQFIDKMDSNHNEQIVEKLPKPITDCVVAKTDSAVNPYDDMYYEKRQAAMNMLNYRKSAVSMELNQRPSVNPFIKPVAKNHPESKYHFKMKAMFLCNNV